MNVGANGFLDKNELSVVCEHIGMEGIDEDVSIRASSSGRGELVT